MTVTSPSNPLRPYIHIPQPRLEVILLNLQNKRADLKAELVNIQSKLNLLESHPKSKKRPSNNPPSPYRQKSAEWMKVQNELANEIQKAEREVEDVEAEIWSRRTGLGMVPRWFGERI